MSEFKGTKGKWKVYDEIYELAVIDETKKQAICFMPIHYDKSRANVRLIAKSPELLHEIEESVKDLLCIQASVKESEKLDSGWEGVYDILQKQIDRKKQLIKSATKIK